MTDATDHRNHDTAAVMTPDDLSGYEQLASRAASDDGGAWWLIGLFVFGMVAMWLNERRPPPQA